MPKRGWLIFVCAAVLSLTACLQSPQTQPASRPSGAPSGSQLATLPSLADNVAVASVEGGDAADPLWTPASFRPELEDALASQGYLAPRAEAAFFAVEAELIRLEQPSTGEFVEILSVVAYTLVRRSDGSVILNRTIAVSYTAATLEAARDGSIRANVAQFTGVLSETWAAFPDGKGQPPLMAAAPAASSVHADPAAAAPGTEAALLQQEFDGWLFANRQDFDTAFGRHVSARDKAPFQYVSNTRVLERTPGGYLVEVTYTLGSLASPRVETNRFLVTLDGGRRLAGVESATSI